MSDSDESAAPAEAASESDLLRNRRENLRRVEELGRRSLADELRDRRRRSRTSRARFETAAAETLEAEKPAAATAGRVLALRTAGKAGFLDLSDGRARLQVYVRRDAVGDAAFELYRALDLGDWIGVEGEVFRTRTGELSVKARRLTFLAKCFRPLPEKWHGLKDVERRYRQRYLDLAVNPGVARGLRAARRDRALHPRASSTGAGSSRSRRR